MKMHTVDILNAIQTTGPGLYLIQAKHGPDLPPSSERLYRLGRSASLHKRLRAHGKIVQNGNATQRHLWLPIWACELDCVLKPVAAFAEAALLCHFNKIYTLSSVQEEGSMFRTVHTVKSILDVASDFGRVLWGLEPVMDVTF